MRITRTGSPLSSDTETDALSSSLSNPQLSDLDELDEFDEKPVPVFFNTPTVRNDFRIPKEPEAIQTQVRPRAFTVQDTRSKSQEKRIPDGQNKEEIIGGIPNPIKDAPIRNKGTTPTLDPITGSVRLLASLKRLDYKTPYETLAQTASQIRTYGKALAKLEGEYPKQLRAQLKSALERLYRMESEISRK